MAKRQDNQIDQVGYHPNINLIGVVVLNVLANPVYPRLLFWIEVKVNTIRIMNKEAANG